MKTYLIFLTACLTIIGLSATQTHAQRFYADDPIWRDDDQLGAPSPQESVISQFYDFYENTFGDPGKEIKGRAQNVNTLGEVPNSAWYTNRHYLYLMGTEALRRGPYQSDGPSMAGKWEIIRGKGEGITPGFTIKDSRGDSYIIKFDPPDNPEMATAAEIISTKILYALGYHVPEIYLAAIDLDRFVLSPKATTKDIFGNKVSLTQQSVDNMLEKAPRDPKGQFTVIASRLLDGKPLGPFRYYDTRPDDANDIFPHEARRELRGLKVFCAWLNHDDSRSVNTLDMLMTENGRKFVRHYLIDFGSTLGSGSVFAQRYRPGHEYLLEFKPVLKSIFTLGFWVRPWLRVHYPDYPSIGRFEANLFDPEKWKSEYPNAAFIRCDAEDAFWAAKQVMNFADREIRAIVSSAKYSSPDAEAYMIETLIKRRDKIGQAYLRFSGGLDKFLIKNDNELIFEDLPAKHNLEEAGKTRKVTWREFDNMTGEAGKILQETETSELALASPSFDDEFALVEIATPGHGVTTVFIRKVSDRFKVVGVERE